MRVGLDWLEVLGLLGDRLDVSGFELLFVINLNGLIQINYHSSSYKDPKKYI
jgi:hypothetical protein